MAAHAPTTLTLPSGQVVPLPLLDRTLRVCGPCAVVAALAEHPCTGGFAALGSWQQAHARVARSFLQRLVAAGHPCDCAFVTRVWRLSPALMDRDRLTGSFALPKRWPTCVGVRPNTVRACDHWDAVDPVGLGRPGGSDLVVRGVTPPRLPPPAFGCAEEPGGRGGRAAEPVTMAV